MILHVRDEETDRMVRALASRRGISITDAIREAVEEALAAENSKQSLWERTADLRARVGAYPLTGKVADKQFYDELWEEDGK
ncbi:type II toxin-antitoxin system VapB family antitoxin [Mesorhizobium sp. CC13]|uniref:type II toxin-antitoxin system VapB family antitoxin n=1 Tax=Mesorhizobium sp. CC13 TaxID=3029194 RepID=UPI00326481E6